MNIKFYLLSISIFFIIYFSSIILNKPLQKYSKKIGKHLLKNKTKPTNFKISYIYNLILLFLVIWISIITLYTNHNYTTIFITYNNFIYKIGSAIFFFLAGMLCSQGKNILRYLFSEYIYIVKTLCLTGTYIILLYIIRNITPLIIILLTFINLICIINYLIYFQKQKIKMNNTEFILNFIWLLWISFTNSFILINYLINL